MRKKLPINKFMLSVIFILTSMFLIACTSSTNDLIKTIMFVTETGIDPDPIIAEINSDICPPSDPSREGYRFDGWTLNSEPFMFDKMPDHDITLYAAWTKLYTISFDTGISGITFPPIVEVADTAISAPTGYYSGYYIAGWMLNGTPYTFSVMPDSDITLTAIFSDLPTTTITFVTEAATAPDPIEAAIYSEICPPSDPEREGYRFGGWTLDSEPFVFDKMPDHDITLYAVWNKLYTISFDTGIDGITIQPIVEIANATISAPLGYYSGYIIGGWMLNGTPFDFSAMPDSDVTLTPIFTEFTNLPTMFINLTDENGNMVSINDVARVDYVNSSITLTNTKEEYELYDIAAGFRGRGNGSWNGIGAKNGYKIKFDKKQSIFGQTANKHWVILACTNFDDTTMSRNYLAYNMAREIFSNIEHCTIAEWVDIYINGNYHGVYLLCEHTRVDKGRVDISSEYKTEPEHNGFLIEYDAYGDQPNPDKGETYFEEGINYFRVEGLKYPFTVHSPDPEDYADKKNGLTKEEYQNQVAYIKDYVTRVYRAALDGDYETFEELADVQSFVDMYILNELFKNVDLGYSSFYLYKKPDGKLFAGPPWDFDATTNIGERGDRTPQGLYIVDQVLEESEFTSCELYISLYQNESFLNAVIERWKELSPAIDSFIDEHMNETVYNEYKEAMGKNFAKWKNKSQDEAEARWVNDMETLRIWFKERIAWLNDTWK